MSDFRVSSICGLVGIVIGFCAFLFNYNMVAVSLPGYEILVAPAMFLLSFFSEETDFIPKMILFIFGQFTVYFCLAYLSIRIKSKIKNKA